jgi:hypothetical protein
LWGYLAVAAKAIILIMHVLILQVGLLPGPPYNPRINIEFFEIYVATSLPLENAGVIQK